MVGWSGPVAARQPYVLRSLVAFLQGQHGDNLDSVGPQLIVEKWKESFVYTVRTAVFGRNKTLIQEAHFGPISNFQVQVVA